MASNQLICSNSHACSICIYKIYNIYHILCTHNTHARARARYEDFL